MTKKIEKEDRSPYDLEVGESFCTERQFVCTLIHGESEPFAFSALYKYSRISMTRDGVIETVIFARGRKIRLRLCFDDLNGTEKAMAKSRKTYRPELEPIVKAVVPLLDALRSASSELDPVMFLEMKQAERRRARRKGGDFKVVGSKK